MYAIEYLPTDVIYFTFGFLSPTDLIKLARVSKRLKMYADSDIVWKTFVLQEEELAATRNLKVECESTLNAVIDTETVLLVPREGKKRWKTTDEIRREMETNWDYPMQGLSWKQLFLLSMSLSFIF